MPKDLRSYNIDELAILMSEWGEPKYRAKQIFSQIHKGLTAPEMTNLPKALRDKLSELPFGGARIVKKLVSERDGTKKYLFALDDDNIIEGVLMHYKYGNTLCISTQVGCNMGCAFCASTLEGCVRNLTAGEMLAEVIAATLDTETPEGSGRPVTNIVLMGSGEPLDNYDETIRFLKLVSSPDGMNISPRNISLSTCGLVTRVASLIEDAPHVTLSLSLHAPNDETRSRIMPINRRYGVGEVINAAKLYADKTGRRVVFEYALIHDVNDRRQDAEELCHKLRGINCHVNLIPLNSVKERNLEGTTRARATEFASWLTDMNISATVRREMGADINGACGQLRRKQLMKDNENR